jgi:hypothetical protein
MKKLINGMCGIMLSATFFTACTPIDDSIIKEAKINIIHASPDAPSLDVLIDDVKKQTGLSFDKNTGYSNIATGTRNLKLNTSGTSNSVLFKGLTINEDENYTIIAANKLGNIEAMVVPDDLTPPAAGKAHIRFAHLSPDAPTVDVLNNGNTIFSAYSFKNISAFRSVDAGALTLNVKVTGTTQQVLSIPLSLVDGKIYTLYAKGLASNGTLGTTLIANN